MSQRSWEVSSEGEGSEQALDVETADLRQVGLVRLSLQARGVDVVEEMLAVFDHVVEDEEAVGFGQEVNFGLGAPGARRSLGS